MQETDWRAGQSFSSCFPAFLKMTWAAFKRYGGIAGSRKDVLKFGFRISLDIRHLDFGFL
jgi:hypothetical protein